MRHNIDHMDSLSNELKDISQVSGRDIAGLLKEALAYSK
jgi:hypothetical protein